MQFIEFNLDKDLQKSINDAGYIECTPIQEKSLEHTLRGIDIFAQSQTGTGKTAAFLIPLLQQILTAERTSSDRALIIAPTRELVTQIEAEARLLSVHCPISVGAIFGGVSYYQQERMLADGTNIIIATPGRLLDFVKQRKADLKEFGFIVIDEADRLFDMGFYQDLRRIMSGARPASKRQTMLFSATLDFQVRRLAREYMHEPAEVEIEAKQITVDNINQELYHVSNRQKMSLLLGILKQNKPKSCLLFVNMKSTAEEVTARLRHNGYECDYLTGDLSQSRRQSIVNGFKDGRITFLIATDVAARGLHINDLELVVNYDIPEHSEYYVHRIGRTARAGKTGTAITLACEQYVESLSAIEKYIGIKIPSLIPEDELYIKDSSANISRYHLVNSKKTRGGKGNGRNNSSSSQSKPYGSRQKSRSSNNRRDGDQRYYSDKQKRKSHPTDKKTDTIQSGNLASKKKKNRSDTKNKQQDQIQRVAKHHPETKPQKRNIFKKIISIFKR